MTVQVRPWDARDPFWWSLTGFVAMLLIMVGLIGYFGTRKSGCACERETGRCSCRR